MHLEWEYVVVPWQRAILLETRDGQVVQQLEGLELDKAPHDLKPARKRVTFTRIPVRGIDWERGAIEWRCRLIE